MNFREENWKVDKIEDNVSNFELTDKIIKDIVSSDFERFGQEKNNYRMAITEY